MFGPKFYVFLLVLGVVTFIISYNTGPIILKGGNSHPMEKEK